MALVTVAEYEDASGLIVTPEHEPEVQSAIDSLTLFIERYIDWKFSVVTDEEVKAQSNYDGIIPLSPYPIIDVSAVTLTRTSFIDQGWDWDDIDTIFGLLPHRAYTVVYSYGTDTPPDDLKAAALQLLVVAGGSLKSTQSSPLIRRRVGDVEEEWGKILSMTEFAEQVLESYRASEGSMYIGPRQFPNPPLSFQQGGSGS